MANGNDLNERSEILNKSVDSTATNKSTPSTQNFSICSKSSLLVPSKLHAANIVSLKECYTGNIKYVDPTNNIQNKVNSGEGVLMLDRNQIISGLTKNKSKLKVDVLRNHLADLLDHVRPVCLPDYQCNTQPVTNCNASQEGQINDLIAKVESLSAQSKSEFETINQSLRSELDSLKSVFSSYENFLSGVDTPTSPVKLIDFPSAELVVEHSVSPVENSVENFVPEPKCTELLAALSKLTYTKEKGRETVKFGESYTYNGSRNDSTADFPPIIKELIDELNSEYVDSNSPLLNSCVVTKYVGPKSYIPLHSDDERSIHPESNIYSVSVGKEATVRFSDIHNKAVHEHTAGNGSLYVMSRKSQCFF